MVELVSGARVRLLIDSSGPESTDRHCSGSGGVVEPAEKGLEEIRERAAHVREVLTGFRSGSSDIAEAGEPRADSITAARYATATRPRLTELGVDERTDPPVGQGISRRTARQVWSLHDSPYRTGSTRGGAKQRWPSCVNTPHESKPSRRRSSTKPRSASRSVSGTALSQNRPGRRPTGSSNGLRPSTAPSRAPPRATGISPRDRNGPTGNCSRPDRAST